jgi:hypothetical protein
MQLLLLGILLTLTPSMLVIAWLIWQSNGRDETAGLDVDRAP